MNPNVAQPSERCQFAQGRAVLFDLIPLCFCKDFRRLRTGLSRLVKIRKSFCLGDEGAVEKYLDAVLELYNNVTLHNRVAKDATIQHRRYGRSQSHASWK